MYGLAHRVAQYSVDHLVSFDQTLALELITHHQRFEMISTAGHIADFNVSAGQAAFDHLLQFRNVHHRRYLIVHGPAKSTSAFRSLGGIWSAIHDGSPKRPGRPHTGPVQPAGAGILRSFIGGVLCVSNDVPGAQFGQPR
jgi:hypothetical protein